MSRTESRKRLDNSRIEPDFWWFECADIEKTLDEIEEHGRKNCRLRVYPGLAEDGSPDLHLFVVPHGELAKDCGEGENCSHICPPNC